MENESNSRLDLLTEVRRNIAEEKKHGKPAQYWKQFDDKANKSGSRRTVFWVTERKLSYEERLELPFTKRKEKIWEAGASYVGDWKNNRRDGYGTMTWENGNRYEGEWSKGKRSGHGAFFVRNGSKLEKLYSGNWRNGMKDGAGTYFYPDGSRYEGQWRNDMRHGRGTQFFNDGKVYIGEWFQDQRCGWGRIFINRDGVALANGDEYDGEWLNDKREGQGQFFYRNRGRIYNAEWVDDIATCGVYSEAPLESSNVSMPWKHLPFPELGVANPDDIIEEQLKITLRSRAAVRAIPQVQLHDLFTEQEISDLHELFLTAAKEDSGKITAQQLQEVLDSVGLPLTIEDIGQIFVDLNKQAADLIDFAEFVKAIYLVKEKTEGGNEEEPQSKSETPIASPRENGQAGDDETDYN